MEYLQAHRIPFQQFELDSAEGQQLMATYQFKASPGILVEGVSINPYEVLIQPACRVNEEKLRQILDLNGE